MAALYVFVFESEFLRLGTEAVTCKLCSKGRGKEPVLAGYGQRDVVVGVVKSQYMLSHHRAQSPYILSASQVMILQGRYIEKSL